MVDAERDGPVPPAPLVKGPFGDRLPVIRGLLPSWEVYLLVGTGLAANVAIVNVLAAEYVLCPDRKDANYIGTFKNGTLKREEYIDARTQCDLSGSGFALAIGIFLLFVLCAYATSAPFAEWKARGLSQPSYPLTVGEEHPEVKERIATWLERLQADNGSDEARRQLSAYTYTATWPSLVSWEGRRASVFVWVLGAGPVLFLAIPVWAAISFVSADLTDTWGPETRWDSLWPDRRAEVQTPSDLRDEQFLFLVSGGSAAVAATVAFATASFGGTSLLRKGYYIKPHEGLVRAEWRSMRYYDATPLLSGRPAVWRGSTIQSDAMGVVQTEKWDGNP